MKQLIIFLLAGAILMWTSASFAQWDSNSMGLTGDPNYLYGCIIGPGEQVYTTSLFLADPVNPEFDGGGARPVSWINGFECRVWIEGNATLLSWNFPVNAIDVGTEGNTAVGFAEPVPVIDGMAILATLEIFVGSPDADPGGKLKASPMPCDGATVFVHMAPTRTNPSIEGMMAYLDADDPDNDLVGATAAWVYPEDIVLLVNVLPVAVDQQSWGAVKALYR